MVEREGMENLLLRYYEGGVTEEEAIIVKEWLKSSEENRRIAKQIQLIELAVDIVQTRPKLDVKKALVKVHKKMELKGKVGRYMLSFRGLQRVAAILFIPLLLSWCLLYFNREPQIAQMVEIRTNPGMTASIVLPDSTVVILNSSSSLQYPSLFSNQKREVKLVGEAFFSVKKDKRRMFVVNALNNSRIVVYGTEFDVEAYQEDKMVQTTLVSGKVSFSYVNKNGRKGVLKMEPGQKVVYDIGQKNIMMKKVNVDVETSWKDGLLMFKNTPFGEVLRSLSKRYNVEFVVKKESLKQEPFTGTFTRQRLERILEHFRISSNIHFQFVENDDINEERQRIEVY
ncbi:FecR domain-containing protein [uncultured Bacteroides sp.]|uniref:FecR family protein n=1 Tax=uncultured Bacteroides sp. TaxID=162156 RepID=UPI002AA71410|nr:FecR domain-containing protein [uncultured Bacteroides sp.]